MTAIAFVLIFGLLVLIVSTFSVARARRQLRTERTLRILAEMGSRKKPPDQES